MNNNPQVSLIIVSRDRPDDLKRVLASLRFQTYDNFEVVVVSNENPEVERVRYVAFDRANISAARNIGVDSAAGDIIAFCDDDAIPEPQWLSRLVPAFGDAGVGIVGGFVRGRNGISFQWKGLETDKFGQDYPIEIDGALTRGIANDRMLKVQGTNCAFRKSALIEIGGFDEGFAFYLDETDVSWRLAQEGWKTTIISLAEVQHGFAPSDIRGANRAPRSLHQIGMSMHLFLQKHAGENDISSAIAELKKVQHNRLSRLLIWGQIEPSGFSRLLASLDDGLNGDCETKLYEFSASPKFKKFPTGDTGRSLLYAGIWHIFGLMRRAQEMANQGQQVTVFCFSRTSKFHNRYFDKRGFWVQRGGIFGKSDRALGYINPRMISIKRRVERERIALSPQREFEDSDIIKLN
jgi:cellulose synthase/poly-beta-1,6-N-acetylglucosamine synthase-like glycosyltransferase